MVDTKFRKSLEIKNPTPNIKKASFPDLNFRGSKHDNMFEIYINSIIGINFLLGEKWGKVVEFHTESRRKSPKSRKAKQARFDKQFSLGLRKDNVVKDIYASSVIIDRVKDDLDGISEINPSKEVKELMSERHADIDLLANLVNFFNRQEELGCFSDEYDNEATVTSKLRTLHIAFNDDFGDNFHRYRPNMDISEVKKTPLNDRILKILEENRDEAIKRKKELISKESKERKDEIIDKLDKYNRAINILKTKKSLGDSYEDDQEEYYKFLIVLLDRVKKLEYAERKEQYDDICQELEQELYTFASILTDPEKEFSDNVLLEDLEKLELWCKKLNAQMSDKLQQAILKDFIKDIYWVVPDLIDVHMEFDEDDKPIIQSHVRENGYVADHGNMLFYMYDGIVIPTELQFKTHYRKKVATTGTASQEDRGLEEKARDTNLLPKTINNKMSSTGENADKIRVIEGFGNIEDLKTDSKKWLKSIVEITPRFITTTYKDSKVIVHNHSMLENVEKYYGETSKRKKRNAIKNGMAIIRKFDLLPSTSREHVLTLDSFLQTLNNNQRLKRQTECVKKNYGVEH